jgi:hypothetical protein
MKRYALYGEKSRTLLTFMGRVLVHDNKAELEYLTVGAKAVECPSGIPEGQTFPLRLHPNLTTVEWPLRKESFR